ncbi:hypothetical protein ABZT06_42570 [Streptomyces sp. NPDC005483]|uniref:HesB/IscA family protein n=1 Tax=Streptomyces sp. NPDC005483 TaxID=3154882 RepID=UPI0033B5898E
MESTAEVARLAPERPKSAVTLTDEAVAKITELLAREEPGIALQVAVEPGGCAGLRYKLFFTDRYSKALALVRAEREGKPAPAADDPETAEQCAALEADDIAVGWFGPVSVVTAAHDDHQLEGARIGYQETLESWGFTIDNPNSKAPCACSSNEPCG